MTTTTMTTVTIGITVIYVPRHISLHDGNIIYDSKRLSVYTARK